MKLTRAIIVTLILAMAVGLGGCITINPSAAPATTPTPRTTAPSIPKPTIDFLEFPAKSQEYTYATIKIKASKPGAYSLQLVDENAGGLNSNRLYALGTILTDDYGIGKWHFKVDKDFELDRVKIFWHRQEGRSLLVVDMAVVSLNT